MMGTWSVMLGMVLEKDIFEFAGPNRVTGCNPDGQSMVKVGKLYTRNK
jgi:hypothetical protein